MPNNNKKNQGSGQGIQGMGRENPGQQRQGQGQQSNYGNSQSRTAGPNQPLSGQQAKNRRQESVPQGGRRTVGVDRDDDEM